MDSAYSRYRDNLLAYGERLSTLGIDQLEEILLIMSKRRERWGSEYSFALSQEIKKRGHLIDYDNYKIIYYHEETNP